MYGVAVGRLHCPSEKVFRAKMYLERLFKTFLEEIQISSKFNKLKLIYYEPALKCENIAIFTLNLFIAFKMAYSCRFRLMRNLNFLDYRQKKFIASTTRHRRTNEEREREREREEKHFNFPLRKHQVDSVLLTLAVRKRKKVTSLLKTGFS